MFQSFSRLLDRSKPESLPTYVIVGRARDAASGVWIPQHVQSRRCQTSQLGNSSLAPRDVSGRGIWAVEHNIGAAAVSVDATSFSPGRILQPQSGALVGTESQQKQRLLLSRYVREQSAATLLPSINQAAVEGDMDHFLPLYRFANQQSIYRFCCKLPL